jgi:protocatechuate 3,4-dioxygenase alpha subunit
VLAATPSQTVGPFFAFGLCRAPQHELVDPAAPGALRISGRVLDGAGEPVPDAMVEIWQAAGWGRSGTDAAGEYGFVTVADAPYVSLLVFARGLMKQLHTRMYFPGAADPLLAALTDSERASLIGSERGPGDLRFDIHLQGDSQTAFFAL